MSYILCWYNTPRKRFPIKVYSNEENQLQEFLRIIQQGKYFKYEINRIPVKLLKYQQFYKFSDLIFLLFLQIRMEKKLAKMLCQLLFIWVITWSPYAIITCWVLVFNDQNGLTPVIGIIPVLCCKFSASVNASLYGLR